MLDAVGNFILVNVVQKYFVNVSTACRSAVRLGPLKVMCVVKGRGDREN